MKKYIRFTTITIFLIGLVSLLKSQTVALNVKSVRLDIKADALVYVNGTLQIDANSNYLNNGEVQIKQHVINNDDMTDNNIFNTLFEEGKTVLNGTAQQNIQGSNTFYAHHLVFNNTAGFSIQRMVYVDGEVEFKNGVATATTATAPLRFTNSAFVSDSVNSLPKNSSHINGYVVREDLGEFTYPVGDGTRYQKVTTEITSVNDPNSGLLVRYFGTDAGAGTFSTNGLMGNVAGETLVLYNKQEYWDIKPSEAGNDVEMKLTLYWDSYKNGGITNTSHLRVAHKHGTIGDWRNEGRSAVSGNTTSGQITNKLNSVINNFSPFTLGSISPLTTLPLKQLILSGYKYSNSSNQLKWNTATEDATGEFDLQMSSDGQNYISVYKTLSLPNTTSYSQLHTVVNSSSKSQFYRVIFKDLQGDITQSNIVKFKNNFSVNVYPIPAKEFISISSTEAITNIPITIIDAKGKIVHQQVIKSNVEQINVSKLASGTYYIILPTKAEKLSFIKL